MLDVAGGVLDVLSLLVQAHRTTIPSMVANMRVRVQSKLVGGQDRLGQIKHIPEDRMIRC